jgi:serine protease Do
MLSALPGFAQLAERLQASTVRVGDGRRGAGSGVVWSMDGLVMTNAHVARGRSATVTFHDGRRARARVIARDDERDLAALRLENVVAFPLPVAGVRDASSLRVGELVFAVGNPLGLVGAMTAGIVQRLSDRFVIADLRLEPGNSGGPLADAQGRVVGINSMVARGLALAVPSGAITDFLRDVYAAAA